MRRAAAAVIVAATLASGAAVTAGAAQLDPLQGAREQLSRARAMYDALEWEGALPVLDALITSLVARPAGEDGVRPLLAAAYELRARSRFGLSNRDGARQDLTALVTLDPAHALPGNVAAGVSQMFDEVKRASVGVLLVTLEPIDAALTIDGIAVSAAGGPVPLAVGPRTVAASRGGYRPFEQQVNIVAGTETPLSVTLERIASRVTVLTSPADVEVVLDGIVRGRTPAGPAPEVYADAAARIGVTIDKLSGPIFVDDVGNGSRLFEFRRPCYITKDSRRTISVPQDWVIEMKLDPAAATVKVQSNVAGAEVLLNGESKGTAPLVLPEVCEGPQVLEVTAPVGRFIRRFEARAKETLQIDADVAPALALVSVGGDDARYGGEDLRLLAERQLEPARSLTVFLPRSESIGEALGDLRLPPEWLAVDRNGRPLAQAAEVSAAARREASQQLARRFGAQGVAGISLLPGGEGRAVISLLAAGAADPDVLEIPLGSAVSAELLRELDAPFDVQRPSLDFTGVDIADVPGAAVVTVVPGGQAAQAGIGPGDVIVGVREAAVASVADLERQIAALAPGQQVPVAVRDRNGSTRTVMAATAIRPLLVSVEDRMTRFNKLALDLRFRLTNVTDPTQEMLLRLNLAVALLRLGNAAEARRELARVKLADGPGISNGTVQYLQALTFEATNQPAEAELALRAAAAIEGARLSTFGPLISDLVKARAGR